MRKLLFPLAFFGMLALAGCPRNSSSLNADGAKALARFIEPLANLDCSAPFYNPRAMEMFREANRSFPEMENENDRETFAAACRDPNLFRQLDRRYRFDVLILSGDPVEFRPLLDHLIQTRDWTLVHLDPANLIFRRGDVEAWKPENIAVLLNELAGLPEQPRRDLLVQVGNKLLAVEQPRAAKQVLDSAISIPGDSAAAYTTMALYHTRYHRWNKALASCNDALKADPKFVPALSTKSQLLFSIGKADEALNCSRRLVSLSPEDPKHLFLHAKICHQAHAYVEEIAALTKLVELAEGQRIPTGGYRVYLAQAYAAAGQAAQAVREFETALGEGSLSAEQITFAKESIEKIRSRASL